MGVTGAVDDQCVMLGAGIWHELLQHGFFKRSTEQKLVCAKGFGELALVPNFYGTRDNYQEWQADGKTQTHSLTQE
jgi:hypothetical protein